MRFANLASYVVAAALLCAVALSTQASEDIIILEQDYKILESSTGNKGNPEAKDTRQILYITRDIVAIDEYGGDGTKPTETFLIDMVLKRIVNIDHTEKKILINESFDERRAQIQRRMESVQTQVDDPDSTKAIKDRFLKMYATMLDKQRDFVVADVEGTKVIAGVKCKTVKVIDRKDAAYPALTLSLHPEMDMPYDNSEVLFLIKVVGEKMAQFLKSKQSTFSRVPMEMHIQTAEGGKLDTKVVKVTKMKFEAFDPKAREFGNPFEKPEGYSIVRKLTPKEKPKEKAD